MDSLATLPTPIGLDASRTLQEKSAFKVLKAGGLWSRTDYIVNTPDGSRFMMANHKTMSSKREITDQNGSHLFGMRMDKFKFPVVLYLERPDGTQLVELKGKWSWARFNGDLHFTNVDGQQTTLELRDQGSSLNESFDIIHDGRVVAHMARHDYNRKLSKEQGISQWYDVNVAANVDTALICAATIALDEVITITRQSAMANPVSMAAAGITSVIAGKRDAKKHPQP